MTKRPTRPAKGVPMPRPSLAERATTWIERYTRMPTYFDEREHPTLRAAYFAGYEAARRDAKEARP
jgi:hypothetical protein